MKRPAENPGVIKSSQQCSLCPQNVLDGLASMKALRVVRSQRIAKRHLAMYRTAGAGQVFVEEETLLYYDALKYYPVHINQTFCNRYKVAAKLGFGGSSTVWLCEDIV